MGADHGRGSDDSDDDWEDDLDSDASVHARKAKVLDRTGMIREIVEIRFPQLSSDYDEIENQVSKRLQEQRHFGREIAPLFAPVNPEEMREPIAKALEDFMAAPWSEELDWEVAEHGEACAALLVVRDLWKSSHEELTEEYEQTLASRAKAQLDAEQREDALLFDKRKMGASFDHWSDAAVWTLAEGVALMLGYEPNAVNVRSLKPWRKTSPLAKKFYQTLDLAGRESRAKSWGDEVQPEKFVTWAEQNGLSAPHELKQALLQRGDEMVDWKARCEDAVRQLKRYRPVRPPGQAGAEKTRGDGDRRATRRKAASRSRHP